MSITYFLYLIGLKKSLFNVFQNGNCNPNLALVIDDRLKVWDEKDQPRVHVVPAFAPYYAPQAEVLAIFIEYLFLFNLYTCEYFLSSKNFALSYITWLSICLYPSCVRHLMQPLFFVGQQCGACPLCCKKCCLQC